MGTKIESSVFLRKANESMWLEWMSKREKRRKKVRKVPSKQGRSLKNHQRSLAFTLMRGEARVLSKVVARPDFHLIQISLAAPMRIAC